MSFRSFTLPETRKLGRIECDRGSGDSGAIRGPHY